MKFGKKQIVLGALILALGTAVYLNWQFSDNSHLLGTNSAEESIKQLGQAQYANGYLTDSTTSDIPNKQVSVTNNTKSDSDTEATDSESSETISISEYFVEAKQTRDEAQEKIVEIATEVLKNTASDEASRSEAVVSAAQIAAIIQQQSNIESLIKAKGFQECMVFIQNNECSVVVNKGILSEALAVSIKDIVSSQSGITFDKINITEV